jgi:hypothetical protein
MKPSAQKPILMRRWLASVQGADAGLLDAVADPSGKVIRIFSCAGLTPADLCETPPKDCLQPTEVRDVAGAVMITAKGGGKARLALKKAVIDIAPDRAEPEFLQGRNCLLAMRIAETPQSVVDWLACHLREHGANGAVIFNRAPASQGFGDALDAAIATAPSLDGYDLRVVLVESPLPLGKGGLGPESHPFLAPDAPGKDRMEQPAPDPWLAPLGEPLVFEIAKWRFLSQARAVLALDCSDLLCPRDGQTNAFDLCASAVGGVALLVGRRIYPWRVRNGCEVGFGDHICRQFDGRRGIARWGVAPEAAGLDKTWRGIRVSYARPDPGQIIHFWRAMGLRVPGFNPSELAPKTSLVEDPALVAAAQRLFGANPVRPPVSVARAAPRLATEAGRTCIITTMKNEGPFILEWLAYHRAIGIDDFLVYSNDCTDGTDQMLDILQAKGLVTHRQNPFRGTDLKPQHAALQAAESEDIVQGCGWAICMDVDEFINIRIGDGRLPGLYAAMGDANMISLTWRLFGNADVAAFDDSFKIAQFTLAAPELIRKPHQAWGFKTLFRTIDIYKKLGVHRPKGLRPDLWDQVKWLNGSGKPMPPEMYRNGWRSTTETYGYDWVQLNHYACRSAESFLVKRERGRVNHTDRDQGLNYWFRMNHNAVEDRSILRMVPALRAEWDRLVADPAIAAAHRACVDAHRAKIADLRARESYQALYDDLTGPRMRRLSRLLQHFGASVFNAGPEVIPEGLHTQDLPEDFFFTVDHQGDAEH